VSLGICIEFILKSSYGFTRVINPIIAHNLSVSLITAPVYFSSTKSSCFNNVFDPITVSTSSLSL
jgi:hypothetical protein